MQSSIFERKASITLDYWLKPNYENQNLITIPAFHVGISCKDHPDLIYGNPISWRDHFLLTHGLIFEEQLSK